MPALMAIFGANAEPFKKELLQAEVAAARAGKNIERAVAGGGHVNTTAMRETLTLLREMGRGNWSRIPGSLSILISQFGLLELLLSPVTLLVGAAAAAAAFLAVQFYKLSEATKNENDLLNKMPNLFERTADAMRNAAIRAEEYAAWLQKLHETQENLNESTEETLRQMREVFALKQRIAGENGQTPREKAIAELEEKKRELQVITEAAKQASQDAADKEALSNQATAAIDPKAAAKSKVLDDKAKTAAQILDAITAKQSKDAIPARSEMVFNGREWATVVHPAIQPADQIKSIDVGGKNYRMSLNQAQSDFDLLTKKADDLAAGGRAAESNARAAKEQADQAKAVRDQLQKEQGKLQFDVGAEAANLPAAGARDRQRTLPGHFNELQAHGGFSHASAIQILDVNRSMDRRLQQISDNTRQLLDAQRLGGLDGIQH